MAITFPRNPNIGDSFVGGNVTWTWDGISWNSNSLQQTINFSQLWAQANAATIGINIFLSTHVGAL